MARYVMYKRFPCYTSIKKMKYFLLDLLLMYTFAALALIMSLSALHQSLGKQLGKNRASVRLLTRLKGGSAEQDDMKPFYALGVNVARQVST